METEWQRPGEVARGAEAILRIRRLGRSFFGAHGGPAPHPSNNETNTVEYADDMYVILYVFKVARTQKVLLVASRKNARKS